MDRINSDNVGYDAQGRRIFKDGPPATTLAGQWCTGVQEELMSVIESEGFAGSVSDNTLMLKAITAAIARATDNYVTVHDLGTKNILSAYSSFNLDLYISGGLLAKPSGWKCKIACSNGNGSYYCDPSTVYNIKGITGVSAVSALNYRMFGTGNYILEIDNINSTWNIIEDNTELVYLKYKNSNSVAAETVINFSTRIKDSYSLMSSGTMTIPKSAPYAIASQIVANAASGTMKLYKGGALLSFGGQIVNGTSRGTACWIEYLEKGETISIRHSQTSLADADAHVELVEQRIQ